MAADAMFRNFDPFFIASESRRNFAYQHQSVAIGSYKKLRGPGERLSNNELLNVRAALTCQEHVQQQKNCDQNHQNFEVFTNVGERGT